MATKKICDICGEGCKSRAYAFWNRGGTVSGDVWYYYSIDPVVSLLSNRERQDVCQQCMNEFAAWRRQRIMKKEE